jgi:hypothetical protein
MGSSDDSAVMTNQNIYVNGFPKPPHRPSWDDFGYKEHVIQVTRESKEERSGIS